MCWISFGYDPRANSHSKVYQIIDMRLPSEVATLLVPKKAQKLRVGAPVRIRRTLTPDDAAAAAAAMASAAAVTSLAVGESDVGGGADGRRQEEAVVVEEEEMEMEEEEEEEEEAHAAAADAAPDDLQLPTQRHVYCGHSYLGVRALSTDRWARV